MPDLRGIWARLRESFWFVPGLIVLTSIALAMVMVELSGLVTSDVLDRWPRLFGAGAEGARGMLSAIAGSMITVAGITFSITMVAVTQASTQYSPRVLRNFMRDRANQMVLGVFVGVFAYCLVVLRTIRGDEESPFVPSIAVLVGMLLALVGIAVLIYFIHHIATTLQASDIIARVATETCATVDQLYPDEEPAGTPSGLPTGLPPVAKAWRGVTSRATGYVQRADVRRLVEVADEHGLAVRVERTAGDFVIAGQPLAWLAAAESGATRSARSERSGAGAAEGDPAEALRSLFAIGANRTPDHDARFGIRQLVDIALKALSPGINDSTTAVTCVDYLGAVLLRLANRRIEVLHLGSEGHPRVLAPGPTFEELLDLAMDEIRRNTDGNVTVLTRQLEVLGTVGAAARSVPRRRAVAWHVELLRTAAAAGVTLEHDRARVDAAASEALAAAAWP